jgi:hypothetical protein
MPLSPVLQRINLSRIYRYFIAQHDLHAPRSPVPFRRNATLIMIMDRLALLYPGWTLHAYDRITARHNICLIFLELAKPSVVKLSTRKPYYCEGCIIHSS